MTDVLGADVVELDFDAVCEDRVSQVHGAERIVAAGGDGSLGPAARLAAKLGLPLAVIPVGTANSFARWIGLPLDPEEAARLAVKPDPITMTVEVAEADGRPFVNVASTGLSVTAARGARPLKSALGPVAYAVGAVRAGIAARHVETTVRVDGFDAWRGRAWKIAVAASGAFGGDSSTGGIDPVDEKLDVAIVEAGPRRRLVRFAAAMRRGKLVRDDDVLHLRGREIEIDVPPGTTFNVDGEVIALQRARFSVLGTLQVVAR